MTALSVTSTELILGADRLGSPAKRPDEDVPMPPWVDELGGLGDTGKKTEEPVLAGGPEGINRDGV